MVFGFQKFIEVSNKYGGNSIYLFVALISKIVIDIYTLLCKLVEEFGTRYKLPLNGLAS